MKLTTNEKILIAQYHKKEREIKELKQQLEQQKKTLRATELKLDVVKHLNQVLVNQISSLSSKLKQWAK